ncbi:MAG: tetratricopeptide repeat protein, partial [Rudaea sp.]
MTLGSMESRFYELKGKLAVGLITEEEFKREMEKLRFQDRRGRWWMIGAQSGKWYSYDGTRWLPGQPPEPDEAPVDAPKNESETGLQWPGTADTARPGAGSVAADSPAVRSRSATPSPQPSGTQPTMQGTGGEKPGEPAGSSQSIGLPPRLRRAAPRRPTLGDRVREEMSHAHLPDVHMPGQASQVHLPALRAPGGVRRYPPAIILAGGAFVGLVLVFLFWFAVDNVLPGKPISSFLGRSSVGSEVTPPALRVTPTIVANANIADAQAAADDLAAKSQLGAALGIYQNAARLAPGNTDILVHYARALALSGRIQDAVSTAERAVRLDPRSADAYAELARALAWSGKAEEAVQAGKKAVELDGTSAAAHAFLAEAYLRSGQQGEAEKEAAAALQIDEKNIDANRAAGWAAAVGGLKSDAAAAWQRVFELAPDVFFYHYEFGQV